MLSKQPHIHAEANKNRDKIAVFVFSANTEMTKSPVGYSHLEQTLCQVVPEKLLILTSVLGKTLPNLDKSACKNPEFPPLNCWKGMPPWLLSLGAWYFCDWRASFELSQRSRASC